MPGHKVRASRAVDNIFAWPSRSDLSESSADIEASLRAQAASLPLGIRGNVSRNTLASQCDARLAFYAKLAERFDRIARGLYAEEPSAWILARRFTRSMRTTIDLCLSVFPGPPFRSTRPPSSCTRLLDLRGNIPSFIHISDGKMHDVNVLDLLLPEPGAYYVMDRGYLDFERLHHLHEAGSFFVTRAKSNLKAERRYFHPVDRATGLILRSNRDLEWLLLRTKGFRSAPSHQVHRSEVPQAPRIPYQSVWLARIEHRRLVSLPLAGELFFKWINSTSASRHSSEPPRMR